MRSYPYEDPLSSINIHYASEGQELGWHFDNSSFAITLLLENLKAAVNFNMSVTCVTLTKVR